MSGLSNFRETFHLPSTGLAPSQFRYDFWPGDGLPGSTNIASFAPEFHDIRVGVEHR